MSSDEAAPKALRPAGPIARAYGLSRANVAVCIGPTGGGKTTESVRRIRRIAQWQHPSPRDNVRKARILCVAPTYRRIWDQVLPSYFKEVDRAWGTRPGETGFRGARGDPADHFFALQGPDGGLCYVEVLFRAVGDISLEEFFRGFECTAVWLPEMDTHETEDILSLAANRCGRYPEPDDRPDDLTLEPAYNGVYGDANAPVIGSWFFERFYVRRKPDDAVFKQPGGLLPGGPPWVANPRAENLQNLRKIDPNYYPKKALEHDKWAVRRLLESRPGFARDGEPVHDAFDVDRMALEGGIEPVPGVALEIGADMGNTLWPSAVFAQRIMGQVRVLAEVAPKDTMDINEFANAVRVLKETRFAKVDHARLWVDPSAAARSTHNQQMSYAQILQGATGIEVGLAPTNNPALRRSALNTQLKRWGPGGEPGYVVDLEACPEYVAAMTGGYRFKFVNGKKAETPEKNIHSHRAEAGQYLALGFDGLAGVGGGFIHGGGDDGHSEAHSPILVT